MDSLPNRELTENEVDALEESDAIENIFPIYIESPNRPDRATGLVLVRNQTAYALAFEGAEWNTLETRDVETVDGGVQWDDNDTIRELQDLIAGEIGAVGF